MSSMAAEELKVPVATEVTAKSAAPPESSDEFSGDGEFGYKPITPLAPLTLFIGLCSLASLLWLGAIALALTGVILGLLCLWRIRQMEGEVSGGPMAMIGLALSGLMLVGGSGYHGYIYATEVPEGHERLSFNWLSEQSPIYQHGRIGFGPEVAALNGKKVFVKGYMYPTQQQTGIVNFTLCKDTGECCFGGNPKVTDMIQVKLNGLKVNHRELMLVGVAGTLRIDPEVRDGELVNLYVLEGTHFQ